MAKKNVHRRNRTSGTDSSSSKDDEFVSSSEEESASSSSSEEVVKYLDSRSYKRLKESIYLFIRKYIQFFLLLIRFFIN
jgi:hypothetical protein